MNKLLTAGIFGTLLTLTYQSTASASIVSRGFFDEQIGNYATLDLLNSKANQSDLTNLSNKVGTLPTEITVGKGLLYMGFSSAVQLSPDYTLSNLAVDSFNAPFTGIPSLDEVAYYVLFGNNVSTPLYPNLTRYMGLLELTATIGEGMNNIGPVAHDFLTTEFFEPNPTKVYQRKSYGELDLVGYLIALFGDSIHGEPGYLDLLLHGSFVHHNNESITLGILPNYKLASAAKTTADSAIAKIGTLPDGYETVGAALEAINAKVDNKITNLSTTASNGKYVLTAVKEGDQTTYAWESIDRSESETTTTE